jgi:hypothetical protein
MMSSPLHVVLRLFCHVVLLEAFGQYVVGSRCAKVDVVSFRKIVLSHEFILLPAVEAIKRVG